MDKYLRLSVLGFMISLLAFVPGQAQNAPPVAPVPPEIPVHVLSIEDFVRLAAQNDTVFDEILIDQMTLAYRRDLNLPARDLVLSVTGQYELFLSQERDGEDLSVSLSKLFPSVGTDVSVTYDHSPSISSVTESSELEFMISQPIAENAFGRATRMRDKIIGIEIDVIRYQIVEAYEDYLAGLIDTYYRWYSAHENMKIGETSYQSNQKLLDNMLERQKQKIALPVDVNKVELLVAGKKENLINLTERFNNLTNLMAKAVRHEAGKPALVPADPSRYHNFKIDFDPEYSKFTEASRTYGVLRLLEKQRGLEVKKNADDLLPSTNLLIGYRVSGDKWGIVDEENLAFAGLSIEWPFPDQVERAEYEVARISHKKTALANQNKYLQLYTDLRNLHLQIKREEQLIELAQKRIALAESILEEETRNYSYGKITLNDYLDAVNDVDTNNFNRIAHTVQLNQFLLDWLRLTDQLVDEKVLGKLNANGTQ